VCKAHPRITASTSNSKALELSSMPSTRQLRSLSIEPVLGSSGDIARIDGSKSYFTGDADRTYIGTIHPNLYMCFQSDCVTWSTHPRLRAKKQLRARDVVSYAQMPSMLSVFNRIIPASSHELRRISQTASILLFVFYCRWRDDVVCLAACRLFGSRSLGSSRSNRLNVLPSPRVLLRSQAPIEAHVLRF
jgi:hypothetical protein